MRSEIGEYASLEASRDSDSVLAIFFENAESTAISIFTAALVLTE